ncbi:MAG: glycoside hydrolase family 26 protein [Muribaculaceae bacterium]|nr:glycoside hydrolase family 26 protein [Muribaculaceae bacterium]
MKNKIYNIALLAAMAAAMPAICSCDDAHEPYVMQEAVAVAAPVVSIANGTVLPAGSTSITLTYAVPVALNSAVSITLNDEPVSASLDESRTVVTVPVTLGYSTSYVLNVPQRAVAGIGTHSFAPEVSVTFTTEARPAPVTNYDAHLVNPNATAEAQEVYKFLLEQNGKKVLSGASAGNGNNNTFADWVASHAGQYPAVAGYDFLHHKRSGENWINYSDISAATSHWQNNGLVNYMWHWNVPTDEDAYNNKDWNHYAFYCSDTNFDINNALTEGTWENKVILEDIDQIAGYLGQLQAAGVPVIWRPLHEAAGSHLYNNPWFWWGRGGIEATKQLWKLMYDRLVNQHGLNNLIWVWTAQWDKGYEAQMAEAYPGNEYVDVVGVDSYRNPGESEADYIARVAESFYALSEMVGGKKLVALSECGYMTELGKTVGTTPWAWFMVWNSDISNNPSEDGFGNSTAWIKTVFESENVLNREGMPSLK